MVSKRGGQGPRTELHILEGIFHPRLGDPEGMTDPATFYFAQKTHVSREILKNLIARRTTRKEQSPNLTPRVREIDFTLRSCVL
jgi:hypothetical protein